MIKVPGGEQDPFLPARVGVDAVGLQYHSTVMNVDGTQNFRFQDALRQ